MPDPTPIWLHVQCRCGKPIPWIIGGSSVTCECGEVWYAVPQILNREGYQAYIDIAPVGETADA